MDISGIKYLGIDRVLKRGTGEVLADLDNALLVHDNVSNACFLACEDESTGIALLVRYTGSDCRLLMVSDYALGQVAFERYEFSEKIECYQFAYYSEKPVITTGLSFREADEQDLPMLARHYQMISPEELKVVVRRKSILLGYDQGHLVGFIGEYLEGSMGILFVLPEYRQRGFGTALQNYLIAKTMEEGFVPFGQVEGYLPLDRRGFFYIQIILELVARLSYNVHEEKFVERLRTTVINRQLAERLKN